MQARRNLGPLGPSQGGRNVMTPFLSIEESRPLAAEILQLSRRPMSPAGTKIASSKGLSSFVKYSLSFQKIFLVNPDGGQKEGHNDRAEKNADGTEELDTAKEGKKFEILPCRQARIKTPLCPINLPKPGASKLLRDCLF